MGALGATGALAAGSVPTGDPGVGVLLAFLVGLVFILASSIFQVFSQAVFVLFFREIAQAEKEFVAQEVVETKETQEAPLPDPAAGN